MVYGLGIRVKGLWFRVQVCRVEGLGLRVSNLEFWEQVRDCKRCALLWDFMVKIQKLTELTPDGL